MCRLDPERIRHLIDSKMADNAIQVLLDIVLNTDDSITMRASHFNF